jgi:hypothetical protein
MPIVDRALPVWLMSLPILRDGLDELAVVDPDTGGLTALRDASDRALAHAARLLAEHDSDILQMKRALAAELRERHGVGQCRAGGYAWEVAEATSWPVRATQTALEELVRSGAVSAGDADRCLPRKPKPSSAQIKALLGRLMVSDPDAARRLSEAATVSPASVRDVREVAIDVQSQPSLDPADFFAHDDDLS